MITGGICLIMRALGELLLSNTENHFLDFVAEYLGKKWAFHWLTYWFC